jgi:dynein heavy chain 2
MLPCQQSMMLENALKFEKLIKNQKTKKDQITWDNPDDLEQYISKLQAAAEKLSGENRKLRRLHQRAIDLTVNLMNIDLLRQQQKWKDIMVEIRQTIGEALQMVILLFTHFD